MAKMLYVKECRLRVGPFYRHVSRILLLYPIGKKQKHYNQASGNGNDAICLAEEKKRHSHLISLLYQSIEADRIQPMPLFRVNAVNEFRMTPIWFS
jgi:hypothetical protein